MIRIVIACLLAFAFACASPAPLTEGTDASNGTGETGPTGDVDGDDAGGTGSTGATGRALAAASFTVTTNEDTLVVLPLTVSGLAAAIVTSPAHGTLTLNAASAEYTPALNYHGSDAVLLTTDDGTTLTTYTVDITITPVIDAPTAVNDDVDATLLAPATFTDLLANDTQIDGDPLRILSVPTESAGGATLTLNTDGSVTYDATGLFAEVPGGVASKDTFTYLVSNGGPYAVATVTVHFEGLNDAPASVRSVRCFSDALPTARVVSDPDGAPLTVSEQMNTCGGLLHIDATGLLAGTCEARAAPCSITVDASDGSLSSNLTVEILANAIFVAASATGSKEGNSWANAVTDLQTAINLSNGRDLLVKAEPFALPDMLNVGSNLRIFGGFAGNENGILARGSPRTLTELTAPERIARIDAAQQVLIDGVRFSGGRASDRGAALEILNSQNITMRTVGFDHNSVTAPSGERAYGGAVYVLASSNVSFERASFYANEIEADGPNSGGGALFTSSATLTFTDCVFQQNQAHSSSDVLGGAIAGAFGSISATRTHFLGNTLTVDEAAAGEMGGRARGGAIALDSSSFSSTGCVFSRQTATAGAGGPGAYPHGEGGAGGAAEGAGIWLRNTPLTVVSGIFAHNRAIAAAGGQGGAGEQFASFSELKGGMGGSGGVGGSARGGAVFTNAAASFDQVAFRDNAAVGATGGKGGTGGMGATNYGRSGDGGDGGRGGDSANVGGGALFGTGAVSCVYCSLMNNKAIIGAAGEGGDAGSPGTSILGAYGAPGNTGSAGVAATNVGVGGIEGPSVSVKNSALSQNAGAEQPELSASAQVSHSCVAQALPGATHLIHYPFVTEVQYASDEIFMYDVNNACLEIADPLVQSAIDVTTLTTGIAGDLDTGLPNAGAHYDPDHGYIRLAYAIAPGFATYETRHAQTCDLIVYSPYGRYRIDAPGGVANYIEAAFDIGSDATFVCQDRALAFKLQ